MKSSVRLLVGIRSSVATTLTVTLNGMPPPHPLGLRILKAGVPDQVIQNSGATWTASLGAGDHVVYLPVSAEAWFTDPLSFSLGAEAVIVILGEQPRSLVSWTSNVGIAADPKDPVPTPNASPLVYELANSDWLLDTLKAKRDEISPERIFHARGKSALASNAQ